MQGHYNYTWTQPWGLSPIHFHESCSVAQVFILGAWVHAVEHFYFFFFSTQTCNQDSWCWRNNWHHVIPMALHYLLTNLVRSLNLLSEIPHKGTCFTNWDTGAPQILAGVEKAGLITDQFYSVVVKLLLKDPWCRIKLPHPPLWWCSKMQKAHAGASICYVHWQNMAVQHDRLPGTGLLPP